MTRAHMADPHIVREDPRRPRGPTSAPASAPTTASTASTRAAAAYCIHNPATGRELDACRTSIAQGRARAQGRHRRRRPGRARGRARRGRARARGDRPRGGGRAGRPDPPDRAEPAAARDDLDHRLAHGRNATRLRRRRSASTASPRPTIVLATEPGRRHRRHRRPAAHRGAGAKATSSSSRPGTSSRATSRPGSNVLDLRRRRRPCRAAGGRDHRGDRRQGRDHDAATAASRPRSWR